MWYMAEYESLRCNMKMKSDGTSSRGYEGSRKKLKSFAAASLLAAAMFLAPSFAYAVTSDLSITQSQITFSQSTFYVGDVVRGPGVTLAGVPEDTARRLKHHPGFDHFATTKRPKRP